MIAAFLLMVLAGEATSEGAFRYPTMELDRRLAAIWTVSECQYISGLTCRISYNGSTPLPSEVFFTEFDAQGQRIGKRRRLIYPELKKGESGRATFRLRSGSPHRIRLEAVGSGPWKDPY